MEWTCLRHKGTDDLIPRVELALTSHANFPGTMEQGDPEDHAELSPA